MLDDRYRRRKAILRPGRGRPLRSRKTGRPKKVTSNVEIGQTVKTRSGRKGIVKYIGNFDDKIMVGIMLTDESMGTCDGSYKGISYFSCESKQGLFVRLIEISHVYQYNKLRTRHEKVRFSYEALQNEREDFGKRTLRMATSLLVDSSDSILQRLQLVNAKKFFSALRRIKAVLESFEEVLDTDVDNEIAFLIVVEYEVEEKQTKLKNRKPRDRSRRISVAVE